MDMSRFAQPAAKGSSRLEAHTRAIRENQISVALVFLYLQGYEVELLYMGEPQLDKAKEVWDELPNETKTPLWSVSTTSGGIWETWERDALKYGSLSETSAWDRWNRRLQKEADAAREEVL